MRVLHLDGGRGWAGGQNQVRQLMRELARRGVKQLCVCPAASPLEARLREERLPVEGVAWRGGSDPRAMLAVGRRLRGWDVAHCHDAHALQVALPAAKLLRRPVVASRRVHFRTSARKWGAADRVLAISGVVERALLDSGVPVERIRRVPSGVDLEEVAALEPLRPPLRERLGIPADAFLVGNIGQLQGYKGQELLPMAAALLPPELHWAVLGEGPRRETLEREIAERGVGARVHLPGFVPDARRALPELDLFAFPSPREPLGSSLLDAMAAGVPCIGADAAGAAEILGPVHRRTGHALFPAGDAAAMARLVSALREDGALRARVLEAQAERVREFAVERTADRTLRVYEEVAGRGSARTRTA